MEVLESLKPPMENSKSTDNKKTKKGSIPALEMALFFTNEYLLLVIQLNLSTKALLSPACGDANPRNTIYKHDQIAG